MIVACSTEETESAEGDCYASVLEEAWDDAITCFENGGFEESPAQDKPAEDYEYLLQWAGSYGGKYGLAGSGLLSTLGSDDDSNEGSESEEESSFDFSAQVRSLTESGQLTLAITQLTRAVALLNAFPAKYRTESSAESVYYAKDISLIGAIFTAFLVEMQKQDFSNSLSDGTLTQEELVAKADAVLETLANGGDIVGDPSLKEAIDKQISELENQPGDSTAEKLEALINS
ncbi:MAG: hypothetical protein HRU19_00160 [Pseudobacteriovorax sp.]|nr:hypothetical protein [Pseudobacteriovorax sp.]